MLLNDTNTRTRNQRSQEYHSTWSPALGNQREIHPTSGVCDTNNVCWLVARLHERAEGLLVLDLVDGHVAVPVLAQDGLVHLDAVLVRDDGLVVEPNINAYSGALRSASAWKYANDPAAWIAAQKARGEDLRS